MKEVVDNFLLITGYDLATYLNDYVSFVEQDSQVIIDFYQGNSDSLPSSSIEELERLIKEANKIEEIFTLNKDSFNTADFVDLVDLIGDIGLKLKTIQNTAKWTRSSITDNRHSAEIEVDVVLNQNQTLEQLARTIGYSDENNNWIDLALRNDLIEEDYTSQGGIKLKASLQNNLKINIQSVVDTISGESIHGKDLQKKLVFENDDLKTLGYRATIEQAFVIAVNLRRSDNPEFPNDGLQSSLIVGQNLNSIMYPSLFRQLFGNFTKDDTFKSVSVLDVKQSDAFSTHVQLKVQAETRIDEVITDLVLI
jgi:hypothetical protein